MSPITRRRSTTLPFDNKHLNLEDSFGDFDYSEDGSDESYKSGLSYDPKSGLSCDEKFHESASVGGAKRRIGHRRKEGGSLKSSRNLKKSFRKAGNITFATEYTADEKLFKVHILRVFNIAAKRDSSGINPFVRLYLEPGKKQKQNTKCKKGTKQPVYNEVFQYTDIEAVEFNKYKLKIKVYNHEKLKRNELLGEVDIALSSINLELKETFNVDLFVKRSEASLSTVNISICHQATFSKLEVIVHEAKNLPKRGSTSPYVNVSLFKEDKVEQKETTTKRNTREPIFNELLDFDVVTDFSTPLTTFAMTVTLANHNLVGKDEILGYVIFSETSQQNEAATLWKNVQDAPHKKHIGWFSLIGPDEI